ncbi:MAG: hypothetical protein ACXVXZ_13060 [Mycobacteriaceae bacterium]
MTEIPTSPVAGLPPAPTPVIVVPAGEGCHDLTTGKPYVPDTGRGDIPEPTTPTGAN